MKIFYSFVITFFLVSVCHAVEPTAGPTASKEILPYSDPQYGFKVTIPPGWKDETATTTKVKDAKGFYTKENSTILVAYDLGVVPDSETVEKRAQVVWSIHTKARGMMPVKEPATFKIGKLKLIRFAVKDPGKSDTAPRLSDMVLFIHKRKMAVIQLVTPESDYDTLKPEFEKILKTIVVSKGTEPAPPNPPKEKRPSNPAQSHVH